ARGSATVRAPFLNLAGPADRADPPNGAAYSTIPAADPAGLLDGQGVGKPPMGLEFARQGQVEHLGTDHLDPEAGAAQDGVGEWLLGHAPGSDDLVVQGPKLEASEHVGRLVEG